MNILVTGAAGFIGYHLSMRLLSDGATVIGVDNLNNYYDPNLKKARLGQLKIFDKSIANKFIFIKADLENHEVMSEIFDKYQPTYVINLAAQAGVRYSIENPSAYIQSNLVGFGNILEECRNKKVKHLVYASSSSVYGGNEEFPYSENQSVNHPVSIYGVTKRNNELMAHAYSHLFKLPTTGLRFFTVYGPWGRPDMALSLFTEAILNDQPIKVYNNGEMYRAFTYIDDIIEGTFKVIKKPATSNKNFDNRFPSPCTSWAPYRIFNIGNSSTMPLLKYIEIIENILEKKAKRELLPIQDGEVQRTSAETAALEEWIGFKPKIGIEEGVRKFIYWYRDFYNK